MRDHKIAGVKPVETVVKPTATEVKEVKVNSLEEAYKKQNPEKYPVKKAAGAFKVSALLAVIAFIGVLAISLTVSAYNSNGTPKVVVEGDYIEASEVVSQPAEIFGGGGPTNPFNWYSNGGINYMTVRGNMKTATGTLCAILNPFGTGTSTLESFDWQITGATTTAATLSLATSTTPYATSTDYTFSSTTVASGAQESSSWTPGTSADLGQIGPNIYVILQIPEDIAAGSNGAGGWTYTGACQALFRKMPGSL